MAERRLTRSQAIRKHCIECSGGNRAEVRNCTVTQCYLYRFRMGTEVEDDLTPPRTAKTQTKTKKPGSTTTKKTTAKKTAVAKKKQEAKE